MENRIRTIPLTPTSDLLVVEVPETSVDFIFDSRIENVLSYWYETNHGHTMSPIYLPLKKGYKYTILGEVTRKGEIGFDCNRFVGYYTPFLEARRYRDYLHESTTYVGSNRVNKIAFLDISPEKSFITRLNANGIYLTNPMVGKPNPEDYPQMVRLMEALKEDPNIIIPPTKWGLDMVEWSSYEKNTLKEGNKYLVLLREKK